MDTLRVDKWLWAARFFKTRALATKACELGRVESRPHTAPPSAQPQPIKPARELRPGDLVRIRTEGGAYEVEVLALSDIRGPASIAQTLYRETEASREARARELEARKLDPYIPTLRTPGRPTKRDRRLIHRFRSDN